METAKVSTTQQSLYEKAYDISNKILYYVAGNNPANIYVYNNTESPCKSVQSGTVLINNETYIVCLPKDIEAPRLSTLLSLFNQQGSDKYALSISEFGLPNFDNNGSIPDSDQVIIGYGTFASDPDDHSGYFCFSDCSGFVNYVLMQVCKPEDLFLQSHYPPLATDYTVTEASSINLNANAWDITSIKTDTDFMSLIPHGILAWSLSSGESPNDDSGHVMFVNSSPSSSGNGYYILDVLDCSCYIHGSDTNQLPDRGIGIGKICLYRDDQDNWYVNMNGEQSGITNNPISNLTQLIAR